MSDIFLVTDYSLFTFIPNLIIPFLLGIILISLITRFTKRGMDI